MQVSFVIEVSYSTAVFVANDDEHALVEQSIAAVEARLGQKLLRQFGLNATGLPQRRVPSGLLPENHSDISFIEQVADEMRD